MANNLLGSGVTETEHLTGASDTHNEVFTPDSIVNEMLDETDRLLKQHLDLTDDNYLDYIILEPTCGTGNFLVRELYRKLLIVNKYSGEEREIALLRALSSIHGIELTASNVVEAKLRLIELIETGTTSTFELEYKEKQPLSTKPFNLSPNMKKSVQYILDRNIQCGNSLTSKKLLMNKSDYFSDMWSIHSNQINDSIINTSDTEAELTLTQYDFSDKQVAIRERTYKNMHETTEQYINTSQYVKYDEVYTLPQNNIYTDNSSASDDIDEYDF